MDPVWGFDGPGVPQQGSPILHFVQVEDRTAPFKTLQYAINALEHHVVTAYNAGETAAEGLVYALPGLYGPSGSGDILPIFMRDRIHLQGLEGRACVLRGDGATFTPTDYFWPRTPPAANGVASGEVLVDFSKSSKFSTAWLGIQLPWVSQEEGTEMLDSFTFQGGEVQVNFYRDFTGNMLGGPELRARITNCLFDLRDNWDIPGEPSITVAGPFFGIEMAKLWSKPQGSPTGGYPNHKVLIANNTFLMVELGADAFGMVVHSTARAESVAVIDVTDTGCGSSAFNTDTDETLRGVGSAILMNNLFRTPPIVGTTSAAFAMLGVEQFDTLVTIPGAGTLPSNAFDPARVSSASNGYSNGYFQSMQAATAVVNQGTHPAVPLVDCHGVPGDLSCAPMFPPTGVTCCSPAYGSPCPAAPDPVAVINIFDGTTGVDPLFVGEYLAPILTGGSSRYRDWRLLPGSPLIDLGLRPLTSSGTPTLPAFSTDWDYYEPACTELRSFDWDHEQYGNPRDSGTSIDIGFDEFHLFIMAGSYGNDSNSHNVPGFMSSPSTEPGRPTRVMLFPALSASANRVTVHGAYQQLTLPSSSVPPPPGWITPPNTTYVLNPVLPAGFDIRYISFRDLPATGTPTPWPPMQQVPPQGVIPTTVFPYLPLWNPGQAAIGFTRFDQADQESGHGYFGTQVVIHAGDPVVNAAAWTNLQYEYR